MIETQRVIELILLGFAFGFYYGATMIMMIYERKKRGHS